MTTTRKAQESLGLIIHTTFPQSTSRVAKPGTTNTVIFEFSGMSDSADAFMLIKSLKDDMGAAAILDVMHIGFRVCMWFRSEPEMMPELCDCEGCKADTDCTAR